MSITNMVKKVKTTLTFTFSNGTTYTLPLVNNNAGTTDLSTYGTSVKLKEQLYASSGTNVVGNICCGSLTIEAISKDGLLIPNNESSTYYGLMNDTAIVDVEVDVEEDNTSVYMGRYFVDTWESGASSSKSKEVSITCVDLLSRIKNMSLEKIRLRRNLDFVSYLQTIISKLNSKLPDSMKILYTAGDLNIFGNSQYNWQMYFNNIDRDNIEAVFNNIAKDTISYIWIDRNRHLKTDHLLDDTPASSVSNISGAVNVFEYGTQAGDIDKYSGVTVEYVEDVAYEDKEVMSLSDYQLYTGINKISDSNLNSDKVLDIHTVEIECERGNAVCTSFSSYKRTIDLEIESTAHTKATIKVYGTVVNETNGSLTKYKDNNDKNSTVTIENRTLRKELIPTFTSGLVQLMSMKNNKLYVEGYLNPQIKLADTVAFVGTTLGVNNYYKVIGLEFTLGTNYRCKASLLRTIDITPDVESILYDNVSVLYEAETGLTVDTSRIVELSDANEELVQAALATELSNLNDALEG